MTTNATDKQSNEYPEWCNKPFRLTLGEIENPYHILEDFSAMYTLSDIRLDLETWLWYALSTDDIKGGHFFQMHQDIEKLLEAVFALLDTKKSEDDKKASKENAMEEFFGIFSHEIRTILSGIAQATDYIKDTKNSDTDHCASNASIYIDYIKSMSMEGINILDNMITSVQYRQGELKIIPTRVDFDVASFINSFSIPFQIYAGTLEKTLETLIDPSANTIASTDINKLKQIIYNLLHNAFKFSLPKSKVVLQCYLKSPNLVIQVVNEANEISFEEKGLIFDPYQSFNEVHAGSGLGLYICKLYTELLGGQITVDTNAGKQITFTVILPVQLQAK